MPVPSVPMLADWREPAATWERPLATVVSLPPPWPPAAGTPPGASPRPSLATGDLVRHIEHMVPAACAVSDAWAEDSDCDAATSCQPTPHFDEWSAWEGPAASPITAAPATPSRLLEPAPFEEIDAWAEAADIATIAAPQPPTLFDAGSAWDAPAAAPIPSAPTSPSMPLDAWGNPEPSLWVPTVRQLPPTVPAQPSLAPAIAAAMPPSPPALDAWGNPVALPWVPPSVVGGMVGMTQPPATGAWYRQPPTCLPIPVTAPSVPYDPWEVATLPLSPTIGDASRVFGAVPPWALPFRALEN